MMLDGIIAFLNAKCEIKYWEILLIVLFFVVHWVINVSDDKEKQELRERVKELENMIQT